MYIVGTFKREYFDFGLDDEPMSLVGVVSEITKTHLQRAVEDEDYQVIDVLNRKYYDPKQNKWVNLKDFN